MGQGHLWTLLMDTATLAAAEAPGGGGGAGMWTVLTEILILLAGALALGVLAERLKQSAILGYLVAGTLLGPGVLNLIHSEQAVEAMAELGVALLLFAIGLEFSLRRLVRIGPVGLGGGTLQILITGAVAAGLCYPFVESYAPAVAVGAMVALSSTACVLRVLTDRAAIDSVFGRNALGILLLQDMAIVPLVLLVTMLGTGGTAVEMLWQTAKAAGLIVALLGAFFLAANSFLPRVLSTEVMLKNRELPILLAVVVALGSAWASHALGLSPALGAFLAGVMLAESPFALKIRADVGVLRTLFVTLFFASIGMLGEPAWAMEHWPAVLGAVVGLVVLKSVVTTGVTLLFGYNLHQSVATGVSLAQVGEFSFVLAGAAYGGGQVGLIDEYTFRLFVTATVVTLLLTPYLVLVAPWLGRWLEGLRRSDAAEPTAADRGGGHAVLRDHVIIVGFGPAGQAVAEWLRRNEVPILVVDLHPRNVSLAHSMGLTAQLGDASHPELLEHANTTEARAVALTVPDHRAILTIMDLLRTMAPRVPVVARARYHRYADDIAAAGAEVVIDEEELTGRRLALMLGRRLGSTRATG